MRILCVGDSITAGKVGASYVNMLKELLPQADIVNAGVNGETIMHILTRLQRLLQDAAFDYVVLQGGYNDILLPLFLTKGALFKFAFKAQVRKGVTPISRPRIFKEVLADWISAIRSIYSGKIILVTMGCINECLQSPSHAIMQQYNDKIREVAKMNNIEIADCEVAFNHVLQKSKQADYFLESFWNTAFLDAQRCKRTSCIDMLSHKRGLHLTIDGVHLNTLGAEIFSSKIIRLID